MLCKNKLANLANLDFKSKTNNAKNILRPFFFFFGKEITKITQNEMHECYAMQILEKQRKQKQQKKNGHKEQSDETQGP